MDHGVDWYARYPVDYLGGVQGLPAREHAVYSVVIELLYVHGGRINNDPRWIGSYISDMGAARTRNALASLIAKGKLQVDGDGMLTQRRVVSEVRTREALRGKRSENGQKTDRKQTENRQKPIRSQTENNAFSDHEINENKELASPRARVENTTQDNKVVVVAARGPDGPENLFLEVLAAVGLNMGKLPTYWMPPAAELHVNRWRGLGLTDEEIVAAARATRAQHPTPPNGPRALDGAMARLAAVKQAPMPNLPALPEQGAHSHDKPLPANHPDRLNRIIGIALSGFPNAESAD